MNIGLYGGTFSPVHNGHVRAAKLFLEKYGFDKLIIMPAGIPPHKASPTDVKAKDRLEMCRLAFERISPVVEVSDFEINKAGKSYTVETVEYLMSQNHGVTVLCGEDMILCLDTWHRAAELMKMCRFAAMVRCDGSREKVIKKIEELKRDYGADIDLIDADPLEISSTEIRGAMEDGKLLSHLVPESVAEYIKKNRLYE